MRRRARALRNCTRMRFAKRWRTRAGLSRTREAAELCRCAHQPLELADGIGLDLAHALGGNAILVRKLVQGGLVVAHPAPLQDVAAAFIEFLERDAESIAGILFPLLALHFDRGIGVAGPPRPGRG